MYRPPPLRGRASFQNKKVLLVDSCVATREVRAAVLRDHGVEVHEAEDLYGARFLWQPKTYDLVMRDVRRYSPGETLEFYEQIKNAYPLQGFAFLVGPPNYIARTWPGDVVLDGASSGQWDQVITRFTKAA
jgi:CheY-like chemotaxis protein